MARLLALMTLDLSGKADGRAWADRLRERLYLAGGRPNNQRPHDDPKGSYSSADPDGYRIELIERERS